jgi:putative nucleotidyltransferase with HDIG domain
MSLFDPNHLVERAERLSRSLLLDLPERLAHSLAVARRATELAPTVPTEQRPLLVAAAWLHDIGYTPTVQATGFHPLDGARHLTRSGWPEEVACLVAHHSGARFVAAVKGLDEAMRAYTFQDNALSDALTYADQTIGPGGQEFTMSDRVTDMLRRHGADSPNARAHARREPYLLAVEGRMRERIARQRADGPELK